MNIYNFVIEAWGAPKARDYITGEYLILKSSTGGLFQLLGLMFVFVIVMILAYLASVWIGKNGANMVQSKNINIIESYRISPNKMIQIVKLGDKYIAIGVGKDTIEKLAELDEESLDLEKKQMEFMSFSEVFDKVKKKIVKAETYEKDEDSNEE